MLWEFSAYGSIMVTFEELLGGTYTDFEFLCCVQKTSYILGSERWVENS